MEAQQKGLIDRAKGREFMDMPGQDRMESNISASTSQAVKSYREMGSQAGYQDFLNQALQSEQQKLADLGVESARFKLERSKDVDQAMAGMKDIEAMKYRRGVQLTEQQKADIAAAKQTAASNISGGIQSLASVGMMAANKGLTN